VAVAALDQRVGEALDVAAGLPHARVHEDRRVEPLDVVAGAHHRVPPGVLDVSLELDTERAVVPDRPGAAVDLRGLKHVPAPLAQRHELVHQGVVVSHPPDRGFTRRAPGYVVVRVEKVGRGR